MSIIETNLPFRVGKIMISEKKSKLSNFSNFEFYFKFWKKLDMYNQKTMFFSIFPTLRLFFQLCSNFYVLRIWKITISKPLMMESWNFHRLFSMIIYIDDLHFRNHSWKNDCTELENVCFFLHSTKDIFKQFLLLVKVIVSDKFPLVRKR